MGRKRKHGKHLPSRVYQRRGKLYYVHPLTQEWIPLKDGLKTWAQIVEASEPSTTLLALWARFDLEVLGKKAPKTRRNRLQEWGQLEAVFGHMDPEDVEPHHVWQYWRRSGETEGARHNIRCLSALLTYARQSGARKSDNPCFNLRLPEAKSRTRYVTDDEFLIVRDLAPAMIGYAMDLALVAGMSQIDILKLERRQLRDDGIFFERTKTGKEQVIEWNEELRLIVAGILRTSPQLRRVLICTRHGKPYTSQGFQTVWQRLMRKADAQLSSRFTFHDLRAKSLSDAESLDEAQRRANHSDPRITQKVYRRLPVRAQALRILDK